jgi:hypothetical protein
LKNHHFSSDTEVIAAVETWLYGQPSEIFWVACKGYSIGLRSVMSFMWSTCMLNKSRFVTVACVLPDQAKNLPAPLIKCPNNHSEVMIHHNIWYAYWITNPV